MYLEKILEHKRKEIKTLRREQPEHVLREKALSSPPPRPFLQALQREEETISVIAEIKRASPSRGDLCPGLEPASLARSYREGGAAALSVLTESRFFKGSLQDLHEAREAAGLPALRKDFIIDPLQLYESRAAGADAVLLIARILSETLLRELFDLCRELSLQPLVEVSGPGELGPVLDVGADLLGINNRDLQTFEIDLSRTEQVACRVLPGVTLVGESGIHGRREAERLQRAGARAALVGEALVQSPDPAAKIRELRGERKERGDTRAG